MWFIYTRKYSSAIKVQGHPEFCRQMEGNRKHRGKVIQTQKDTLKYSLISRHKPKKKYRIPKIQSTQLNEGQPAEVHKWGHLSPTWEGEESNHKSGERLGLGRESGQWLGESGERGPWSGIGRGKRTEALRASRNNGNRQPQEIGGWGNPPECTRHLGGERLSVLIVRDFRWNAQ